MAGFKLKVTPEMESLTQVCVENSKMMRLCMENTM